MIQGHTLKGVCEHAKLLQWGLTLCNPMDYSLPGSSVQGILQTRMVEWVAMPPLGDLPDPVQRDLKGGLLIAKEEAHLHDKNQGLFLPLKVS